MPCGYCGSLSHNRSACPWDDTTKPSCMDMIGAYFEADFYATMNNQDTYHDELTAHLAAQAHPQPHPKRYDHGYEKRDQVWVTTLTGEKFTVEEWARIKPPSRQSPGPITMHEPRKPSINWASLLTYTTLAAGWIAVAFYCVKLVKGLK